MEPSKDSASEKRWAVAVAGTRQATAKGQPEKGEVRLSTVESSVVVCKSSVRTLRPCE